MIKIAIFASGTGSNTKKVIEYFGNSPTAKVELIVSNKPSAGVLQIAKDWPIDSLIIERDQFYNGDHYINVLKEKIDFIVLAGFLWKIPSALIDAFPRKIINIHPALLPKYGGKNMFGNNVHEAVIASGDEVSGITIHYVDEHYDHGDIIFQAYTNVVPGESAAMLAKKIHALEHEHYPKVIESIVKQSFNEAL